MAQSKGNGEVSNGTLGMGLLGLLGFAFVGWMIFGGGPFGVLPGRFDPGWVLRYQPGLIALTLGEMVLVWGGWAWMRWRRIQAVNATRPEGRRVWMPADSLEVSGQVMDQVSRQLAGIPQPATHWIDREATAVRIALLAAPGARCLIEVEVPDRMSAGLRAALGTIRDAELIPADQLRLPMPPRPIGPGRTTGSGEQIDA